MKRSCRNDGILSSIPILILHAKNEAADASAIVISISLKTKEVVMAGLRWLTDLFKRKPVPGSGPTPFPGFPKPLEDRYGALFMDIKTRYKIAPTVLPPELKNGGMKEAHFHLGGKVYKLTAAQWTETSSQIVEKNTELFGKAHSVSFTKMQELLSDPQKLALLK